MSLIKNQIFLILSVVVCIVAVLPLFHSGFFPIHDNEQVSRLYELHNDLVNLHIPPRLSQNLGFGYDYPFFNFYPSFVYYVAEIFKIVGFSFIASTKMMIGLGFVFSSVFMYLFSKQYFGKLGGFVSATLYLYAPYHSVDVYVRGALPEFWTFVFIPALFWVISRLFKNPSVGNSLLLGFSGFCLIFTHNLVAMMAVPFVAIYFFYLLYGSNDRKSLTFSVFFGAFIAILLSAFFTIPAILENKYTMVSLLTKELANYNLHFVSLSQFVNSPWGYGGSVLGPKDGFSLEVGKIQLLLSFLSVLIAIYWWTNKKIKEPVIILFISMFIISIFLQSYHSKPIWDTIAPLSYIQFPWRFMLFSVFTSSFLVGYLFTLKLNKQILYILGLIVVLVSIAYYYNIFRPSKYLSNAKDQDYISKDIIRWKISSMAFEYVPNGIGTKTSDLGTTLVDINRREIARNIAKPNPDVLIKTILDKPQEKKLQVYTLNPTSLTLNTFSFPGWKVFVNGKQIRYNDKNKLKLITVDLPKGESTVVAKFSETSIRSISDYLTILGLVIFVFLIPFSYRKIKL